MGLSFTVGGARSTFDERLAKELAGLLDRAFGEENDWEGVPAHHFGEALGDEWTALQAAGVRALGRDAANLTMLGREGRGVYLPAHVQAVSLPLREGKPLCCASLPGLRDELAEIAERWGVSLVDADLLKVLDEPNGTVSPEMIGLARVALAANEAVRRDCPLWLFG